ncbi:MAG TPA: molybdopterin-dependent oxidoreductase, partial [Thermomicrobiales bacterium]|nr:molybdopterin-dependent oxidoreductase [Thermomicrobiales bacterium]
RDVASTNNMQELFSDVKAGFVVGPNIGRTEPIASYWFYHSALYREAKYVVISQDEFPLCWRAPLWLKPAPGTTATLLHGIARQIVELGLASPEHGVGMDAWSKSLEAYDLARVSELTNETPERIREAAVLYATGGLGVDRAKPDGGYPPALIYNTLAHEGEEGVSNAEGEPAAISAACINLAIVTGNIGRAGGGIATLRGPANYQGATDMGAAPANYPGGGDVEDPELRAKFEAAWLPRWGDRATTSNGFLPVRHLPAGRGLDLGELIAAIDSGAVKAMFIQNTIGGRWAPVNPALEAVLPKLEYLVVADYYTATPLAQYADAILPLAMYLEKDGTMTAFDRTVQRLRATVPPMGEAKSGIEFVARLARRMGYRLEDRHPSQIMNEIAQVTPGYRGITYARLERGGIVVPAGSAEGGAPILDSSDLALSLTPAQAAGR